MCGEISQNLANLHVQKLVLLELVDFIRSHFTVSYKSSDVISCRVPMFLALFKCFICIRLCSFNLPLSFGYKGSQFSSMQDATIIMNLHIQRTQVQEREGFATYSLRMVEIFILMTFHSQEAGFRSLLSFSRRDIHGQKVLSKHTRTFPRGISGFEIPQGQLAKWS